MRRGICRKILLPAAVGTLSMLANAQYLSNQNAMNMDSTDIGRLMQLSNMGQAQNKAHTTSTTHNAGRLNWTGKCGASDGSLLPREPDTFLCDNGSPSSVSTVNVGNDTFYRWSCTGSGGAATSCQAQQRADGICGSSNGAYLPAAPTHMCSSGVPSQLIKIGNQYIWYCQGNYGPRKECTAIYAPVSVLRRTILSFTLAKCKPSESMTFEAMRRAPSLVAT